jgi:hypothetical protein
MLIVLRVRDNILTLSFGFHVTLIRYFEAIINKILRESNSGQLTIAETDIDSSYFDGAEVPFDFKIYIEKSRTRKGSFD